MLGAYQAAGLTPKAAGGGFLLQDYPGAAAAFSLRDLVGTDPAVVRVRRSVDNAQEDFTASEVSNGVLLSWVGAGNTGSVTVWYDQSGNSKNAVQVNADIQPKIVDSSSLVTDNGHTAIQFDGLLDGLTVNTITYNELTAFFSLNAISSGLGTVDTGRVISFEPRNTLLDVALQENGDYWVATKTTGEPIEPINSILGNQILTIKHLTGARSVQIYKNGALNAERDDADGEAGVSAPFWLMNWGASGLLADNRALQANTKEIILYPSDQSANRVGIETHLNNYYGVY